VLIVITYDVNTETKEGRARLRRVANTCQQYGQRVQKSVFECLLGETELVRLRTALLATIDQKRDSLRIYYLSESDRERIESYGQTRLWDFEGPLII
jgi:CRISPR-associated protein Cas2